MINRKNSDLQNQIEQLLTPILEGEPGMIIMARFDNGVIYQAQKGFANITQKQLINENSVFNLASVSKQFTAFSILLLAQEGKLSLDDSILTYLPELGDYAKDITINSLIFHISGLIDYMELAFERGITYTTPLTPEESFADIVRQTRTYYPIDSKFEYNNTGYFLLSQIIERVSQKPFSAFAQERIFSPLQMNDTFIVEQYPTVNPIVSGYAKDEQGKYQLSESPWTQTGDGAVHSSASDLMKWGENFNTANVGGVALITKMTQPFSNLTRKGKPVIDYEAYGFGLFINHTLGEIIFEHSGGWMGTSTHFMRIPQSKLTITVLSNRENEEIDLVATEVAKILLNKQVS
ncbi:beta-lactamase family protein [Proteus vulgaris]|uniref:serine hydrolase domain-containing protein n=1 Tax=Proteus vulgaris TaxID=585 RepID=UPI0018E4CB96|nr:serine hydrolase domain-containing protein [Proteus vulgaris]MBI6527929.1 beta-lactamase family protein [Proteus vulgaris]